MRLRIESQEHWTERRLALLPDAWRRRVARLHDDRLRNAGAAGNAWLLDLTEPFERQVVPLSATDGDIRALAKDKAREMFAVATALPFWSADALRDRLAAAVRRYRVEPPRGPRLTAQSAIARMTDHMWWRRRLRSVHAASLEQAAIGLGYVHKRSQIYASDETVRRRDQQRHRNAAMLADTYATNEHDQTMALAELVARSVANPVIRRGELMTRARGFEEAALQLGHVADFHTLTCPSRMHARTNADGRPNPRYDGTTPRQAQQYLARCWSRARAALARCAIALYGFRIAEPHHDGTPHWHALFFCPPLWPGRSKRAALPRVRAIVRRYFLADSPGEPGARRYRVRFQAVAMNAAAGQSAAGYLAKYIAKNIDGYAVQGDIFGTDAVSASMRVDAWASTWRIRQFQQVGGPPVGVWRELRRMDAIRLDREGAGSTVERARVAADAGDWRAYVEAMGGPVCPRKRRPLIMEHGPALTTNPRTREVTPARTRYGDQPPDRPVGVWEVWSGRVVRLVRHLWRVVSRAGVAFDSPWTRVNNCTRPPGTGADTEGLIQPCPT